MPPGRREDRASVLAGHRLDLILQTLELTLIGNRVAQGVPVLIDADLLEHRHLLSGRDLTSQFLKPNIQLVTLLSGCVHDLLNVLQASRDLSLHLLGRVLPLLLLGRALVGDVRLKILAPTLEFNDGKRTKAIELSPQFVDFFVQFAGASASSEYRYVSLVGLSVRGGPLRSRVASRLTHRARRLRAPSRAVPGCPRR